MRWGWPGGRPALLALAAGVGVAAGQAPVGAWWVTLPALAAVLHLAVRQETARGAAWVGLIAGAGHFGAALGWIVEPFLIDVARHGWMAPFALVFMAAGLALFWAAAFGLAQRGAATPGRRAILMALALTLAEFARGHVLTGFPWALIGHVWIDTALAQAAAVAGPTGLTLMTCLAAALPVAIGWRGAALSAAGLAAVAGFGLWRLAAPDPAPTGLTLRLVQPSIDQHLKWDPARARANLDRLLAMTAAEPRPDLVIWPETAVPYLLEPEGGVTAAIAEAAGGVPVAAGAQRAEGQQGWNSLAVIDPDGTIGAIYDKHHLVPFGEYVPFGDLAHAWFGIAAFAAQQGYGYSAGPGARLLDLGPRLGTVLPLICYEAVFPQDLRAAPGRADWILQITNDAWFGTWTGPYQHLAQARLRAVEQGLPLVRVANTGVSAVIDARGRIREELPLGAAAYRDAALPGALPAPPYARWGEAPVLVLLAGLALGAIRRPRRTTA